MNLYFDFYIKKKSDNSIYLYIHQWTDDNQFENKSIT